MKKLLFLMFVLSVVSIFCKKVETDETVKLVTQEWLKDLKTPWQLAFAADGRIFFTEREGRIRVVKDGVMTTWLNLTNVIEETESGLLGIALDPNFATNGYVYIAYTYQTPDWKFNNRIVRCKETAGTNTGREEKTLIDGIRGQLNHNGGPQYEGVCY